MEIIQGNITASITPAQQGQGGASTFASGPWPTPSVPITITFSAPVTSCWIRAYDVSGPGSLAEFYNAANVKLYSEYFPAGTQTLVSSQIPVNESITSVRLIPGPGDYVYYGGLGFRSNLVAPVPVPPSSEPEVAPPTPMWTNGTTKITQIGTPPSGWTQGVDGHWYPPNVPAPAPTPETPSPVVPAQPTTPTPISIANTVTFPIRMNVVSRPNPSGLTFPIRIAITNVQSFSPYTVTAPPSTLKIIPLSIDVLGAFEDVFKNEKGDAIGSYFDDTRVLKTLLNFGDDYQALLTNWKYDVRDNLGATIFVKLYRPLPSDVLVKTPLWIVRELCDPLLDTVTAIWTPDPGQLLYLRPPNKRINVRNVYGLQTGRQTLSTLMSSGSFDELNPQDRVLQDWYSTALEQAEMNIDYSDYTNFVFFGSAEYRLKAFMRKMMQVEHYNNIITKNSSSLSLTGSANITGSLSYGTLQDMANSKMQVLRSFDGYERFLYYQSGIAYSSSFDVDVDDQLYYHADSTYPKSSGVPVSIVSASGLAEPVNFISPEPDFENYNGSWFHNQLSIAKEYDAWNRNALYHRIPGHLYNDYRSEDFVTFVNLIGHHFDLIKNYIDGMSTIYDRSHDITSGLSKDLIWNVAKSFGIELPNPYAVKSIGEYAFGPTTIYRDSVSETWKRFLHNHIHLVKTKGTRSALRSLLNTYGILPTTVQIRESSTISPLEYTSSYETFEEHTNVLNLSNQTTAFIDVPFADSGYTLNNFQIRFASTSSLQSVLVTGDTDWSLRVNPLSGSYGRLELMEGITPVAVSSYLPIFDGQFYSAQVNHNATDVSLYIKRAEDHDIEYSSVTTGTISNFDIPNRAFVGGNGGSYGANFRGYIDEVRFWTTPISESVFDSWVRYPGLYHGNTNIASRQDLIVRLSFNNPQNYNAFPAVPNETPLSRHAGIVPFVTASGFTNAPVYPNHHRIVTRVVSRQVPTAGNYFDSNKVYIVDEPIRYVSGSSVPVLSHTRRIQSVPQQQDDTKSTNLIGLYFSITDTINDTIEKTMGLIDVNDLIGDPRDLRKTSYRDLQSNARLFWNNYAYHYDVNEFIRFINTTLSPMFYQAKSVIPARAKLLSGIVIEPHILDRSKVEYRPVQKLRTDKSVNTISAITSRSVFGDIRNLQANYTSSLDDILRAQRTDHKALITTDDIWSPSATSLQQQTKIVIGELAAIAGINTQYMTHIIPPSDLDFGATYTDLYKSIDVYIDYFLTAQATINGQLTSGSIFPQTLIQSEIRPISDFSDIGAYTFFSLPNGLVGETVYRRVRQNQTYTNQGTWIRGNIYNIGDMVLQVGEPDGGNDIEYYCISGPIISNMTPALDQHHWRPVAYRLEERIEPRKATLVSGRISLVAPSSPLTGLSGYRKNHYRYTRDTSTGTLNRLYRGCKNNLDSTYDGKSPVEVIPSPTNILVVDDNPLPVISTTNQAGPPLDVR